MFSLSFLATQNNLFVFFSSCSFVLFVIGTFHAEVVDSQCLRMPPAGISQSCLGGKEADRCWFVIMFVDGGTHLIEAFSIAAPEGVRVCIWIPEAVSWEGIATSSKAPTWHFLIPDEGTVLLLDAWVLIVTLPESWEDLYCGLICCHEINISFSFISRSEESILRVDNNKLRIIQ